MPIVASIALIKSSSSLIISKNKFETQGFGLVGSV